MNINAYISSGGGAFGPEPLKGLSLIELEYMAAPLIGLKVPGSDSPESAAIEGLLDTIKRFVNGVLLDSGARVMFDFHWSNIRSDEDPNGDIGIVALKATRKKSPAISHDEESSTYTNAEH